MQTVLNTSGVDSYYQVYGLRIQVDGLLPGLLPAPGGPVDVRLHLMNERNHYAVRLPLEVWQISSQPTSCPFYSNPDLNVWALECADGIYYRISLLDEGEEIGSCVIHPVGRRLDWFWRPEHYPGPEGFFSLIAKRSLGWLLRVRGVTCLHATVIVVENHAIALMGESGAGKSTTATSLLSRGCPLLTDDVAALQDGGNIFHVQPGFPMLPLMPATIEHFFPSASLFRYVWPSSPPADDEKRYVDLMVSTASGGRGQGWRFHAEPMPLAAIYLLGEYVEDSSATIIESVNSAEGLVALSSNTYVGYMLDQVGRAREFERLGRLAAQIPIRHVRRRRGLAYLPQIAEAIIKDTRELAKRS